MAKLGTVQLLNEAIFRSYIDLINRRKNGVVPNVFLQEAKGLHENTVLSDLPGDFRTDINEVSQQLLNFLAFNGFVIVPNN